MPKSSEGSSSKSLTNDSRPAAALRRNQACHQCRRRKLVSPSAFISSSSVRAFIQEVVVHPNASLAMDKLYLIWSILHSDAKRPCSTCIRSHAHALSHPPTNAAQPLPPHPECTFDDISEVDNSSAARNKYERLANRIDELETLLSKKEQVERASSSASVSVLGEGSSTNVPSASASPSLSQDNLLAVSRDISATQDSTRTQAGAFLPYAPITINAASYSHDLVSTNWPPNLPRMDLLRHLVEIFFVFHPHASRLLHAPTFVASLSLSPYHPKFPSSSILHAICAIGSLYTAVVTSPPLPDLTMDPQDELYTQRTRLRDGQPDSFAEDQARLAKDAADRMDSVGENFFQVLQTYVILSWFYWYHARCIELFGASARSLRITVPLGLNACPPFQSIPSGLRRAPLLAPARTVIEDEMRRNTFWLAYAVERQHGCSNGWANSLDDQDISQLLPVRKEEYQQGIFVAPEDRQWSHSQDVLLRHPETQVDAFILYIKGTILISQVKSFNVRYRSKRFTGDLNMISPPDGPNTDQTDPRKSPAFIHLDRVVDAFRSSFPDHLKITKTDRVLDPHLYTATLMPHMATIILHDPYADVHQMGCISALKILVSARGILELIHQVWSSSYDITLLDTFCVLSWFTAARVLGRFLKAAVEHHRQEQVVILNGELETIWTALAKSGERVPLAYRYTKMVYNLIKESTMPQDIIFFQSDQ